MVYESVKMLAVPKGLFSPPSIRKPLSMEQEAKNIPTPTELLMLLLLSGKYANISEAQKFWR